MARWSRFPRVFVAVAALSLVFSLAPAAPAAAACTQAQLVPQLADASVIQGVGSRNGTGGYAPLARGKETLVRFYLTLPSTSTCTLGSGQSLKITSASLAVTGASSSGAIAAYNSFGAGQLVASAMQANSPADPLFVVPAAHLVPGDGSAGFTATFTATINYTATLDRNVIATSSATAVTSRSFEKRTNALRVLVVPMGDASQTYSSQFSASAQTAVQNAMTTLARLYPVEARTGELNTSSGGIRYTIDLAAMVNLKAITGAYNTNGKFCGAQANFDALKGQLAQFLLSWNTENPLATADRVLGVVDSNISDGLSFGCAEGFAAINGPVAWIRAIPDKPAAGKTPAQPSMSGGLAGLELGHTFGLVPLSRANSIGYHAGSSDAIADENPATSLTTSRGYNVAGRSLIVDNRNVMRLDTAKPWNNSTVLMAVQDYADLVCFLGGAVNSECTTSGTAGSSVGVPGGPETLVMSGTTNGTVAGTHVVESYRAPGVAQTSEPAASPYFIDQYADAAPTFTLLSSLKVNVTTDGSHHENANADESDPHGGLTPIGVFAFAYPSDITTTRIVLRKGTVVLYERFAQANPPQLESVTTTDAGAPFNFTNSRAASEAQPAVSPDGKWVAYMSFTGASLGPRILVAPLDGHTAPVPIPAPDGTRIAFGSDRDGNWEIYTANLDGTNVSRLTNTTQNEIYPRFSPDGTRIAFMSQRDGNLEIYVMNEDGTAQTRLTTDARPDGQASWSPDGTRIAFNRSDIDVTDFDVWTMNSDGSGQSPLLTGTQQDFSTTWSPDGAKLAFVSNRSGDYDIWTVNADGSNPIRLTTAAGADFDPAWAPDGSKIAFRSERDTGHEEIYVMNADGTGQTRLTELNDGYFDGQPVWSANGTKIGFHGRLGGAAEDLFVMNADGTSRTNLTASASRDFTIAFAPGSGFGDASPGWRGDGAELAFTNNSELLRVSMDTSSGAPAFGTRVVVYDGTAADQRPARPTYSPTGELIAFDASGDLWSIAATGGTASQLTTGLDLDRWPSWSRTPGDNRIVFARRAVCEVECSLFPALYTVDPGNPSTTQQLLVEDGDMPSWGNAGRIAFARGREFDFDRTIWSIKSNGEGSEQLTSGSDDIAPSLMEPVLAFARHFGEFEFGQNDIMLANLEQQQVLAQATGDNPASFKADLFYNCSDQHFPADVGVPSTVISATAAQFAFNFDQSLACGTGTPTLTVFVNNGVQRTGPTSAAPPLPATSTPKGPSAAIYNPVDGTLFCLACRLPLKGSGKDAENGELASNSLRWFITPAGGAKALLGTGEALDAPAPAAGWTAGTNTITLEATDANGNIGSATTTILIAFDFGAGFLQPIDNPPTVNTGVGGRTYPAKFQLPKPDGTFYTSLTAVASITFQAVACGDLSGSISDTLETTAAGGSVLKYDTASNQYTYNWKTPGPGCFVLIVTLADGSEHRALFNLK